MMDTKGVWFNIPSSHGFGHVRQSSGVTGTPAFLSSSNGVSELPERAFDSFLTRNMAGNYCECDRIAVRLKEREVHIGVKTKWLKFEQVRGG